MDEAGEALEAAIRAAVHAALGVPVLELVPLAGGLGTRRFFRVHTAGRPATLVARVEAPEDPAGRPAGVAPEPALEPLRSLLAAHGLPVPERYGSDAARGIDLLEDVGSRSLEHAAHAADAAGRRALYAAAVALVPRLQRITGTAAEVPAFGRRLGRELIAYKGQLFAEWSLTAALGRPPRAEERAAVDDAFAGIADAVAAAPQRLAHRDLQSQNLHVRDDGGLALLDIQGAFLAPPEYDLVCLLRDSYVELPDAEVESFLAAVRGELPDRPAPAEFAQRFDLLTLSRKAKDHARFLQAASRGEHRYLRYLPATARALRPAAERCAGLAPCFARLAELVAKLPEAPCAR